MELPEQQVALLQQRASRGSGAALLTAWGEADASAARLRVLLLVLLLVVLPESVAALSAGDAMGDVAHAQLGAVVATAGGALFGLVVISCARWPSLSVVLVALLTGAAVARTVAFALLCGVRVRDGNLRSLVCGIVDHAGVPEDPTAEPGTGSATGGAASESDAEGHRQSPPGPLLPPPGGMGVDEDVWLGSCGPTKVEFAAALSLSFSGMMALPHVLLLGIAARRAWRLRCALVGGVGPTPGWRPRTGR